MPKFQALLKALLLRRTKTSQIDGKPILTLPPKVIETTHCVFSSEEEAFYSALRGKTIIQFNKYLRANTIGKNYSNILVLLLRLRQAACHPHLINDIEHKAGEVEEGTMIELAKGLSLATVTRLKEAGIEECPSKFSRCITHYSYVNAHIHKFAWILVIIPVLSFLVDTLFVQTVLSKYTELQRNKTCVCGVMKTSELGVQGVVENLT